MFWKRTLHKMTCLNQWLFILLTSSSTKDLTVFCFRDWTKKMVHFLMAQLYGLGYPRQPSPRGYRAFIYENVVPVGRVKVNPAWLFITLIEQWNVQIFLFLWVSLCHLITVCFAKLIFTYLIRISALNPTSRHYVTLATPELSRVGEPKHLYEEKLSRLPELPL